MIFFPLVQVKPKPLSNCVSLSVYKPANVQIYNDSRFNTLGGVRDGDADASLEFSQDLAGAGPRNRTRGNTGLAL